MDFDDSPNSLIWTDIETGMELYVFRNGVSKKSLPGVRWLRTAIGDRIYDGDVILSLPSRLNVSVHLLRTWTWIIWNVSAWKVHGIQLFVYVGCLVDLARINLEILARKVTGLWLLSRRHWTYQHYEGRSAFQRSEQTNVNRVNVSPTQRV